MIGDTVYAVASLSEVSELDGQYHASTQTIEVRPGLPRQYEKYILCHEIVHGLLEHAGVLEGEGQETFTEEQVACIIGRALPKLLKDNPELVKYLAEWPCLLPHWQ